MGRQICYEHVLTTASANKFRVKNDPKTIDEPLEFRDIVKFRPISRMGEDRQENPRSFLGLEPTRNILEFTLEPNVTAPLSAMS